MAGKPQTDTNRVWLKRAAYLAMAIAVLVGMPLVLVIIADLTGVIHFRDIFGPLVFWNELSGPSFIVAFFAIIVTVGVIVYFILKAFETSEGGW